LELCQKGAGGIKDPLTLGMQNASSSYAVAVQVVSDELADPDGLNCLNVLNGLNQLRELRSQLLEETFFFELI
jgi:hypothetical protein